MRAIAIFIVMIFVFSTQKCTASLFKESPFNVAMLHKFIFSIIRSRLKIIQKSIFKKDTRPHKAKATHVS